MSVNIKSGNSIIIWPALVVVVGLGLWLRWQFIHSVQLYPDEFVSLLAIKMIGEKGLPLMPSGLFYEHGLLFSYLGSLAAWIGPARIAARYVSLLCGVATILLIFVVGWRWYTPGSGLIASAGLAIAPTAIQWSGRARMYALLQLLVLLTVWLLFEGVRHNQPAFRWAALVVFFLATLTHFAAIALIPPLLLAALLLAWQGYNAPLSTALPRLLAQKYFWFELAALTAISLIAFLVKRAGQPKGIDPLVGSATAAANGIMQVLAIYSDLSFNLLGGWQALNPFYLTLPALLFLPFALLAGIVAFKPTSFWPTAEKFRFPSLFLTVLLLITTFEMMLVVSSDRRDDKYLFMLLPVLLLLGAAGISHILYLIRGGEAAKVQGKTSSFRTLVASPLLVVILIVAFSWPAAQSMLANTGDDYDAAFATVKQQWQAGDTIMTGTPAAAALYLNRNDFYTVQRQGGYDYRLLTVDGRTVDRWLASPAIRSEAELHNVLANNNVWLVLERWGLQREYFDPHFQQQLLAQTDLVSEAQGIFILRSKTNPQPVLPEPTHAVNANFNDLVTLSGFTLQPQQGTPGQPLRLTLYWQALATLPHDYTVFVHLRDAAGDNVAQADHRPLGSLYPTSLWPVGEIIRESSELPLPEQLAAGHYTLWVGLYLLDTGQRLPLQPDSSGENAFMLGEVDVQ